MSTMVGPAEAFGGHEANEAYEAWREATELTVVSWTEHLLATADDRMSTEGGSLTHIVTARTPDYNTDKAGAALTRLDSYDPRKGDFLTTSGLELTDHGAEGNPHVKIPHLGPAGLDYAGISDMSDADLALADHILEQFYGENTQVSSQ